VTFTPATPSRLDHDGVLRRHFVVIATARYDDPNYPNLPGVTKEVEDLRAWLCDQERLGNRAFQVPDGLAHLADNPTEEQIRAALRRPQQPWSDADAAVVFVTGHGETADGSHWLVLRDSDRASLPTSALRTSDLVRWLLATGVQHLMLIVDACFAASTMADVARFDVDLPKNWLVLPSAMKGEQASVGALSGAIARAVEKLRGGEGAKYGIGARYFTVEQFLETVQEFVGSGQRITPLHGSQTSGPHLCLPNPHFAEPSVAHTQPRRQELALPTRDLETHWGPRSRGVVHADSPGWLFTGRAELMRELIRITTDAPRTTLISGAAGCGKSAVLARLVTLSDPDFLAAYPEQVGLIPAELRPRSEAVDVAVLATGKWAYEIFGQILEALAVPKARASTWDTSSLDERMDAWTDWLTWRERPVTIVLDGLDEAHDPYTVISTLTRLTSGPNSGRARLLIGVRSPGGPDDPYLDPQSSTAAGRGRPLADEAQVRLAANRLRIDDDPWWRREDLRDYAASVLRNTPGSAYTHDHHDQVDQIAQILADKAGHSFLIARIAAASLADRRQPTPATDPAWLAAVDDGVLGVFRNDLYRCFPAAHDRERAVVLLRAVAFAYGRGLPWGNVWPLVANAVADTHATYGDADIAWLLGSPMAAYLVTDREDDATVYRLFHDTLRYTLRERSHELLHAPT